jgi:hypothetical protein
MHSRVRRGGPGPGEYTSPDTVAADAAGRVYVLDTRQQRINVYAATGEPVDTWSLETRSCCTSRMFPLADGAIWKPVDAPTRSMPRDDTWEMSRCPRS